MNSVGQLRNNKKLKKKLHVKKKKKRLLPYTQQPEAYAL